MSIAKKSVCAGFCSPDSLDREKGKDMPGENDPAHHGGQDAEQDQHHQDRLEHSDGRILSLQEMRGPPAV